MCVSCQVQKDIEMQNTSKRHAKHLKATSTNNFATKMTEDDQNEQAHTGNQDTATTVLMISQQSHIHIQNAF